MLKAAVTFTATLLLGNAAGAAVMIQPASVTSVTPLFSASYQLTNMINKDGLSTPYVSGVTDYASYLLSVPTQASNPLTQYAVMSEATSVIYEFDLGQSYTLSHFVLWNGPASASTRVSTFTISVSSSPAFATLQNLGTFSSTPTAAHPVAAEGFALTEGQGRYVRLEVTNAGGPRTLIGEVAFAAVPEPSTALLASLACLALTRRSRER